MRIHINKVLTTVYALPKNLLESNRINETRKRDTKGRKHFEYNRKHTRKDVKHGAFNQNTDKRLFNYYRLSRGCRDEVIRVGGKPKTGGVEGSKSN